ncbi:MAG: peptidyl-prolyl cis-trans isomerase [Acidobacteriota bacterium]
MLKIIRTNLQYLRWILWLVVAIFILYIFADFGGGLSGMGRGSTYAAKVGDQTVSMAEFKAANQQLEQQYRQIYGEQFNADTAKQMRLPVQALDRVIAQKILLAEARKMGLATSDQELRHSILSMAAFKDESGAFIGDQAYHDLLVSNERNPEIFEREMRDQLTIEKLTQALQETVRIADVDVEKAYREQSDKAKIRFMVLAATRFQPVGAPATAEQAKAYFEAHKESFRLPEQRIVDYVLVDGQKTMATTVVSDADAKAYYDQNTAEFAQEEQVRARHILLQVNDKRTEAQAMSQAQALLARLKKGEDFGKLAAEASEDPGSKTRGGDLGFFGRGRMIKEFEEAAFAAQPGEVVGPVKTSFGVHLIRVEEKKPGGQLTFEQAKPQILNRLRSERAQAATEAKAKELAAKLGKESDLDAAKLRSAIAADSAVATVETTAPFGRSEPVPGIGAGSPFASAAFALEKGKLSEPVRIPRGFALLTVREARPSRLPDFAEAETKVRAAIENERRNDLAMQQARDARAQLGDGKTLDEVGKGLGIDVRDSPEFGPTGFIAGLGLNPQVNEAVFALKQGEFGGPVATPQGPVIFQVAERKGFDPTDFAKQKEQLSTNLQREAANKLLASLVEQRRQELKVSYDRQLLQQFGVLDDEGKAKG